MGKVIVALMAIAPLSVAAGTARAQGSWVVVVAEAGEDGAPARAAADIAASRLRAQGAAVVDADGARRALERAFGSHAAPPPPGLGTRIGAASAEALENAAFGRYDDALTIARDALTRAEPHLSTLARADALARELGDACLHAVRALAGQQRADDVARQSETCLRLLPDIEADPRTHPPEVRAALEAARESASRGGRLHVEVDAPAELCAIRLNGRVVGRSPRWEGALPRGAYQLQVECDPEPGVVRRVEVPASGTVRIEVSPQVAARLSLDDGVLLRYDDDEEREATVGRDARMVGHALEVGNVLLVASEARGTVRLDRFATSEDTRSAIATVRVATSPAAPDVGDAVLALVERRSVDLSSGEAVTIRPHLTRGDRAFADGSPSVSDDGGPHPVGWVLGGAGTLGLGLAWVLQGTWFDLDRQVDALGSTSSALPEAISDRNGRRDLVLLTGAGAAALLTAAVPLLLPSSEGVPWWGWASGAVGVALVAVGLLSSAQDGSVQGGEVTRTIPLGPLLAMHGAPLLAIPITLALR